MRKYLLFVSLLSVACGGDKFDTREVPGQGGAPSQEGGSGGSPGASGGFGGEAPASGGTPSGGSPATGGDGFVINTDCTLGTEQEASYYCSFVYLPGVENPKYFSCTEFTLPGDENYCTNADGNIGDASDAWCCEEEVFYEYE
jgi:hypothetical protein